MSEDSQLKPNFDFSSLVPLEEQVTFPDGRRFLLVEASAGAEATFKDALLGSCRMENGVPVSATNMAKREVQLVADCLVILDKNGKEKLDKTGERQYADLRYVSKWPDRIIKPMFRWVFENSEMSEDPDSGSDKGSDGEGGEGLSDPKDESSSDSETEH